MVSFQKTGKIILIFLRLGMGCLFIYAGILKARNPSQFLADIGGFCLLPYTASVALAIYLPWLEIFCGLSLITRKFYGGALIILSTALSIFIIAICSAWIRGFDAFQELGISCGCFGDRNEPTNYLWLVFRDFAIWAVLFVLLVAYYKEKKLRVLHNY